jgi:diphthamide synthase (EF-2-diphthine--ammonia ligase)
LNGCAESLADNVSVHFWSGGKDSYLALRAVARDTAETDRNSLLLLTTFDERTQTVAHQEVAIDLIVKQAKALGLPLLGVPLCGTAGTYVDHVRRALNFIRRDGCAVTRLVFGDLHLAHVRAWRDGHLGGDALGPETDLNASDAKATNAPILHYPLWQRKYSILIADLKKSGITARICAIGRPDLLGDQVQIGDVFDDALRARLRMLNVDEFGEDGELHTAVEVWKGDKGILPWGQNL